MQKSIRIKTQLLSLFFTVLFVTPLTSNANTEPSALMGAGSHFAWIIFDALKEDLEKATGRKTVLFGENSMLGVGCNAGIKAAIKHSKEQETFGFVCCPLTEEEISKNNLKVYPLAKEPILILVNEENPISDLTSKQVSAIFRGDVSNWKEVGGWDKPIVLVTRLHCKKRPGHWKLIEPDIKKIRQERLNVKDAKTMMKHVTQFKNALGHTGSTWIFKPTDKVKTITVDGYAPTVENLRNGKYPYSRQLSAITKANASPDILKLIDAAQHGPAFLRVSKKYNLLPSN